MARHTAEYAIAAGVVVLAGALVYTQMKASASPNSPPPSPFSPPGSPPVSPPGSPPTIGLIAITTTPNPSTPNQPVEVSGIVTDTNGNPLAGVTGDLTESGIGVAGSQWTSGANGGISVLVTFPASGTFNVVAVASSGQASAAITQTVTGSASPPPPSPFSPPPSPFSPPPSPFSPPPSPFSPPPSPFSPPPSPLSPPPSPVSPPSSPPPPTPALIFSQAPFTGGAFLYTPITNTTSIGQQYQVIATIAFSDGIPHASGTGCCLSIGPGGNTGSSVAIDFEAYAGRGAFTGVCDIEDSLGNVIDETDVSGTF